MSNVYDQAAADIQSIIEDEKEAGKPYTLIHNDSEYPVTGTYGDIGNLLDPITGQAIQGRTIEAAFIAQSITTAVGKVPARGWKARIGETTLFVRRNEYDRTLGVCRLTLGLDLEDDENAEGDESGN